MSKCPSWTELIIERNDRDIKRRESRLREEARRLGVSRPDDPDLWALLHRINEWHDERRRPEVEARAKRVGVPTTQTVGLLRRRKVKRPVWEISYDTYNEEDRQRMCKELGYS